MLRDGEKEAMVRPIVDNDFLATRRAAPPPLTFSQALQQVGAGGDPSPTAEAASAPGDGSSAG